MSSRTPLPPLLVALLFAACPGFAQEAESVSLAEINDAAAFLAGVDLPHRTDHPLVETGSWKSHVSRLNDSFAKHEERVLFPMSQWSNAELPPSLADGSTVRYLFSGPDILHAFHMFPTADTYIMCGLEPVGEIPDLGELNSGNASRALGEVRNALGEIISFSFFRTADMKEDLQFATFHGTTPLMMVFLVRSGQYIKSVEFLDLEKDGTLSSKGLDAKGAEAVKIEFSPRRMAQNKTLYYFSSDLSNGGFPKLGFRTWLEKQPKGNAYLKAASFLMHENWFGEVRDHLLDYSHQVVQDDSGIPFRYFKADEWYVDLFGSYNGPIDLFAQYYQGDMRAAYRSRNKPLDFGTGYKWRKGESNLMRFVRQDAPVEEVAAAEEEAGEKETAAEEKEKGVEAGADGKKAGAEAAPADDSGQ